MKEAIDYKTHLKENLKVTSVRYYNTRNGVGYECKTNYPDTNIWNDGNGGATYLFTLQKSIRKIRFTEHELNALIDQYEGKKCT